MSKLRLLFIKEAQASYISHLDLLRTFQRAFPRTELDIRHSQGYHPHPIISIVLPLPVGQSSDCELLDFEVTQDTDGRGIAEKLNTGMPSGLRVLDCYPAVRPVRELTYLRADVTLEYDNGVPENAAVRLTELLGRQELVIQKRTKRKDLADVDIATMIKDFSFTEGEGVVTGTVTVLAQNPGLNPQLLEKAVERYMPDLSPDFLRIRRRAVLDAEGRDFRYKPAACRGREREQATIAESQDKNRGKCKESSCFSGISVLSYHGVKRVVLCRRCSEKCGNHTNSGMNTYIIRRKNPWISSRL